MVMLPELLGLWQRQQVGVEGQTARGQGGRARAGAGPGARGRGAKAGGVGGHWRPKGAPGSLAPSGRHRDAGAGALADGLHNAQGPSEHLVAAVLLHFLPRLVIDALLARRWRSLAAPASLGPSRSPAASSKSLSMSWKPASELASSCSPAMEGPDGSERWSWSSVTSKERPSCLGGRQGHPGGRCQQVLGPHQ